VAISAALPLEDACSASHSRL